MYTHTHTHTHPCTHSGILYNGHALGQTLGDGEGQRPGVLQSMEFQRVGHGLVTEQQQLHIYIYIYIYICYIYIHWRRKWQSTPVFLPRVYGQRSLAGYSP